MTILTNIERQVLWAEFMSKSSNERSVLSLTKTELRTSVDSIDQWIEDNQASFNSAIPLPARTVLTTKQKVRIFMIILQRRFKVSYGQW